MAIPSSKKELLDVFQIESEKFIAEIKSVPEKFTRQKQHEGNLSVCDILAYQIGWTELLLSWYASGKKNKIPDLPAKGYKWNQLGDLAKSFYEKSENESFSVLLKRFLKARKNVEALINENSDAQLYTLNIYCLTGDKWPLGRWINVNTSSPYKNATAKIRKWKKTKGL